METLAGENDPEGLIAPLRRQDWETALTVILHSPHYTKRVNSILGLPLNVAIGVGAPIEVVTALLEAYPDATTIQDRHNNLPCHFACYDGISSEGMKMLLRYNADIAGMANGSGRTAIEFHPSTQMGFFADEKEQVMKDLKRRPSYWKSKEQQALLQSAFEETGRRRSVRRSVTRIVLGRHLITMIWSRSFSNTYEADNILKLNYKFCKRKDGLKDDIYMVLRVTYSITR